MIIPITIGVLVTGAVYLMMQRGMMHIVFGLMLLSHAANLVLLSTGVGAWRGEPLSGRTPASESGDPLPMAFVLTAIVISFAVTVFMLSLSVLGHDDDTKKMPETGEVHD